jgi:hypothetical protein
MDQRNVGKMRKWPTLLVLALAILAGQAAIFLYAAPYDVMNDSALYLEVADRIRQSHNPFDVTRTPTYPLFLAFLQALVGPRNLSAFALAQTLLTVLAVLALVALADWLLEDRNLACLVGVALALDVSLLTWERYILSEGVALWLTITLACLAAYWVEHPNDFKASVAFGIGLAVVICWRPIFLCLPPLSALFVREKRQAAAILLPTALVLVMLTSANILLYRYWGLTVIGPVNSFGKVIECGLLEKPTTPQFEELRSRAAAMGRPDPWSFLARYPEYRRDNFDFLGAYARHTLLDNPGDYLASCAGDFSAILIAEPWFEAEFVLPIPDWVAALRNLSRWELKLSALAPIAALILMGFAVKVPVSPRLRFALLLSLWVVATDLTAAALSFERSYRLRCPLDWVMLLLCGFGVGRLKEGLKNRGQLQRPPAGDVESI